MKRRSTGALILLTSLALSCGTSRQEPIAEEAGVPEPAPLDWQWAAKSGAALLSVHGTSSKDVWMSGADDGTGPVVLHFDGQEWSRPTTGRRGDLWWVFALDSGPVYFGGTEATVLRYEDGQFERLSTPGLGKHTVYGVWASAQDDIYAVGAAAGQNGFIWHYDGQEFRELPLPEGLPEDEYRDQPGLFKVWGSSSEDVWVVGAKGVVLRGNASDGFELLRAGGDDTLFTVHTRGDQVALVGGTSDGSLLELVADELTDRTPRRAPLLQGVNIAEDGNVWAVGVGGAIYRGSDDGFTAIDPKLDFAAAESLHAVWVDDEGGVWAVGGDVLTPELDQGLALHGGADVPLFEVPAPPAPATTCPEAAVDPEPERSIARRWNEQILGAIRRDLPRPTVHARNLFHLSVALWDAYAAFDPALKGYHLDEDVDAELEPAEREARRDEAMSYAAYRVLSHRYSPAVGGVVSQACFDAFMEKLGYDPTDDSESGDTARALGNRIGAQILEDYALDGANEQHDYADPDGFKPDNPYCVVDRPGAHVENPLVWQQLVLAKAETQNGIAAEAGAQGYIGAHWGQVTPFALERTADEEPYFDLGTHPAALDEALVQAAVDLIRRSAELDPEDDTLMDVSPGSLGNNPLGTNDGQGRTENPVTGESYTPLQVKRSDFGRVLAEFWADGPTSETPPGHWNTMANDVADSPGFERRLFGEGEELDELSWDVHVYLALNGALHDAAIAAWELKRTHLGPRPLSLIRYLAERGQRSDPELDSYDPDGLPLIDGLIELITEDSSRPGERHAHLARYTGEIAVRSWRGEPGDRDLEVGGVEFIRALEWMPYQRRTFVTPAFPGYVSGHSTFSRAAAEVLSGITGSEFFPDGFGRYRFEPGYLFFESGPSTAVELQWASYYDAADQAGQSRVWGGIHITQDDLDGRRVGSTVGTAALAKARTHFATP